jgi:hypothetical protein
MSRIKYELFGAAAEVSSFVGNSDRELTLDFGRCSEGLVSIDGVVSRVVGGICRFDTRLINSGEHVPSLILKEQVIRLPAIVKSGAKIGLATCSDEYTRDVSLRERRLSMRVEALEKEIRQLENKITRTIF